MGGGVSLGSFSGAALTEILKLLVLYGRDRNGDPYEEVILDSMSGSSAGAISLAILMRSLLDYPSTLLAISKNWEILANGKYKKREKKLDLSQCTPEEREGYVQVFEDHIEKRLREYEDYPDLIDDEVNKQLQAIETAQLLQELLWVEEVNIKELFQGSQSNLIQAASQPIFSLLKNSKLIELAHEYLLPSNDATINFKRVQVLDERVLFACSLTNLLPFRLNESFEISGQDFLNSELQKASFHLVQETQKALSSKTHKELRILDFRFKASSDLRQENQQAEANWIKICPSDLTTSTKFPGFDKWPLEGKSLQDSSLCVEKPESWALFAASAIACGSFPIAFPPGILRRWKEEFYPFGQEKSQIDPDPKLLKDQNIWDLGLKSYKFPYLDGGTLNNEPIREAFKLANYLDTKRRKINPSHSFDRLVLFVDPIVDASNSPSYTVEAYSPNRLKEVQPFWGRFGATLSLQKRNVFSKALSLTSMVVGLLRNQGSVKEEYKINNYLETLQLKKSLENHLSNLSVQFTGESDEIELIRAIIAHVRDTLKRNYIPYGTRNISEFFLWAISDQLDKEEGLEKLGIPSDHAEYQQFFFQGTAPKQSHFHQKKYHSTIQKIEEFISQIEKPEAYEANLEELFDQTLFSNPEAKEQSANNEAYEFIPTFFDHLEEEYIEFIPHQENPKDEEIAIVKKLLRQVIKKAFLNIMIDAALDLDGKDSKAERLAVTPLAFESGESDSEVKTIDLPGSEMEAFGGFASHQTRKYSFQYGRYCAQKVLSRQDFRVFYKKLFPSQPSKALSYIPEQKIEHCLAQIEDNLDSLHEDIQKRYLGNVKKDLFDLIETRLLTLFPRNKAPLLSLIFRRANKKIFFQIISVIIFIIVISGIFSLFIMVDQAKQIISNPSRDFDSWLSYITFSSILFLGGILAYIFLKFYKMTRTPLKGLEEWMADTINNVPAKELAIQLKIVDPVKLKSYSLELEDRTLHVVNKFMLKESKDPIIKAFWYKPEKSEHAGLYILGNRKLPKNWEGHPQNLYSEDSVRIDKLELVKTIRFPANNSLLRRIFGIAKSQKGSELFPPIYLENLMNIPINKETDSPLFLDNLDFFVRPVVVCKLKEDPKGGNKVWEFYWEDKTKTLEDRILETTSQPHPPKETELS